jgi:hypothetical protein
LIVRASLSKTIPVAWIIPRGSSIVTGASVSARERLGMTRNSSVVNVVGPTGVPPLAAFSVAASRVAPLPPA